MIVDSYVVFGFNAIPSTLGLLSFRVGSEYPSILSYAAWVRATGSGTVISTIPLGKPAPDEAGIITVNIAAQLTALGSGNYDVSVAGTDAGGTTDSAISNEFTVPLS